MIDIRQLQKNELEEANNFFNRIYGSNRSYEQFEWEFIHCPFGEAIYVAAFDSNETDSKIIGIQCAIPIELTDSKGNIILTAKSEDTLVDPAYRGMKIFERMYQVLFEACTKSGIKFIWGFTPAHKAFSRIGFEIPFRMQQALLVFHPIRSFHYLSALNKDNRTIDKLKILLLCYVSWLKQLSNIQPKKVELVPVDIQTESDAFKQIYGVEDYFTLNESARYNAWRMTTNPFGNSYSKYQLRKNTVIEVEAILNLRDDVSHIEKLFIKSEVSIQPVIKSIISILAKQNTPLIRATTLYQENPEINNFSKELKKAGFIFLDRGHYFVWKSLDEKSNLKPSQLIINHLFTQGNS